MSVPCMLIITTRTSGPNTNTTSNASAGTSMAAPITRFFATRTFVARLPRLAVPRGVFDESVDDTIFPCFLSSLSWPPRLLAWESPFYVSLLWHAPVKIPDAAVRIIDFFSVYCWFSWTVPSLERSQ